MPNLLTPTYLSKGLEQYNPLPNGCVLFIPFWHPYLSGNTFLSADRYRHVCTNTSTTHKPYQGRTFAANQLIELTSSVLNFTSGDFSIVQGVKITDLTAVNQLLCRGLAGTDGYYWEVRADGTIRVATNQAGAGQATDSSAGDVLINNSYTLGFSRSGAAITIVKNGSDITATPGTHTDPLTCSRTTKIGIYDDKAANDFIGTMAFVAVFSKAKTVAEHLYIHNTMKWVYS